MTLVHSMILGPLAAGVGLLCLRPDFARRILVSLATLAVGCGVLALLTLPAPLSLPRLPVPEHALNTVMLVLELAMAIYVVTVGVRARSAAVVLLMLSQAALMTWFEVSQGSNLHVSQPLFVDDFSVLMAVINGLVGGGICLYALGYMRAYHEASHREVADRRPLFFSLLFVFMGAMFGIIFANNLLWLFFFWEITTLCSFLLIGYTQTDEARANALKALTMNLVGGLSFAIAIVWLHHQSGQVDLKSLLQSQPGTAMVPVALLCLAGMTKSAQLPFSGWLLGAMVAPTPVSALLHSSTMVKAGVYLVLRLAPNLGGTRVGIVVALVGALTFVVGSFAAISMRDAKRVLAYSTIANLGLIILCGGIGTYEAMWAGMLLIIFHAVAKCLLFLCVGVIEHKLHSRNIEDMSGLILNLPRLSVMLQIGIAGMFLAPFGMLISKWAVLKAVVDACPPLSVFIAFGSAATLFFWVKWMGKLIEVVRPRKGISEALGWGEAVALYGLSATTALTCLLFPIISTRFIEPHVLSIFGRSTSMSQGNMILMMIMMAMVMLFPLSFLNYGRRVKVMDAYLGGANVQSSVRFRGSGSAVQEVAMNNYYCADIFNEAYLTRWGSAAASLLLICLLALACL